MIYFQCDYAEGCHPKILQKLVETNMHQTVGYGMDEECAKARETVKRVCGVPEADVHFLVGGTQANTTVISHVLRPYEGVISADTGHIAHHETGAIEATGHKVLALPNHNGLISGDQVRACCKHHADDPSREHETLPGMVYVSFPTETGTMYTKEQLTDLYGACREWDIPLFIDGARLGYGIMSPECDMTVEELAHLCDIFYIGGTKCGALFGEAVVINDERLKKNFRYSIKRHGGMFAKGRLLGIQFQTLLEDGLYFEICKQATDYALEIRDAFKAKGVQFDGDSATNQQFPILTPEQLRVFDGKFKYEDNGWYDKDHKVVRFCTCWATTRENVDALLETIATL